MGEMESQRARGPGRELCFVMNLILQMGITCLYYASNSSATECKELGDQSDRWYYLL